MHFHSILNRLITIFSNKIFVTFLVSFDHYRYTVYLFVLKILTVLQGVD